MRMNRITLTMLVLSLVLSLVLCGAAAAIAAPAAKAQAAAKHRADKPAAEAGKKVLRAGAATSNITPWLGEKIVGNWNTPPASRIHDELHASCLVLDDGATRIAIVLADTCPRPSSTSWAATRPGGARTKWRSRPRPS
jgi:hypothetical protein